MPDIKLAAVLIVGDSRQAAQRALDSLAAQTVADAMELIVVDLATRDVARLVAPAGIPTTYAVHQGDTWARARADAVHLATAPIIAFIEDHSTAAVGWAESLVRAYAGPWASVGYVFTRPKSDTYLARAALLAENGRWLAPMASHPAQLLSCGNVSYRRDLLLSLGDELETLLTPDFGAHERFKRRGLGLYVEGGAVVAHESFERWSALFAASFVFCRLLAANRARTQKWNLLRRIVYGLGTLVVSPSIAVGRLAAGLRDRRALWSSLLVSLPVILFRAIGAALGESAGYLFGSGSSERDFDKWELHLERANTLLPEARRHRAKSPS